MTRIGFIREIRHRSGNSSNLSYCNLYERYVNPRGRKLFFRFLEEGMRDSFPVGKGLAGGDRMILVIENFNLTE